MHPFVCGSFESNGSKKNTHMSSKKPSMDDWVKELKGGCSILIQDDGKITLLKERPSLQEMYSLLQCDLVQFVPCTVGELGQLEAQIWCDEEGLLRNKPLNTSACASLGNQVYGGHLHGHVLLCAQSE